MRPLKNEEIDAINATAARLGVDARDLATLMAYETIGTLDPGIKGGANKNGTGRGTFKGLIQFSPANQRHYGVTGDETFEEQLVAVERYLRDNGVKPGMPLEDLYSTVLTGAPGRYTRSDINGNVLQHVDRMERNYGPRVDQAFELYDATNLANYAAQREQEIGGYPAGIAVPPADRLTQVAGSNWNATPTPEAKPSVPSFEVAAADPFEAVLGSGPSSRPRNSAASMEIPSAYQATGPASRPNNSRSAIDVPDIRQPVEGLSALPGVPVQASNPMQTAKTGPSMMEFGLSGVPDIMAGVNALTAQKELAIPDLNTPATDKALAKVQDRIAVPDAMQLEPVNQTNAQKSDKASKKGSGTGAVVGAIAGGLLGGGIPGALAGAKLGHKYGDQISGLIPDISGLTLGGIFPQGFVSPEGFAATPVGMASAAGNAATGGGAWDRGSQDAYWSAYAAGGGGDGAWDVAVASANERREANERNGGGKGLGDSISEAIGSWF